MVEAFAAKKMMSKFAGLLKKRLAGKNLAQLARELKIPRTVLHDWVTARRTPSLRNIDHLTALAQHLGISLDEMLTEPNAERVINTMIFEDDGKKYRIKIERVS